MVPRKRLSPGRLSRRAFLGRTLAASGSLAAAPYVLAGRLAGAEAPSRRITVGCIGLGRQTVYSNLPWFLTQPDVQVVAVSDVDAWRLDLGRNKVEAAYGKKAPSGRYGGCMATKDFREVLARNDIDAIMIATPDHWHAPMALAAARAGKDVSLEKPITRTIEEGRLLSDTMRRFGRVFRTDTEIRSSQKAVRACELVLNGYIGRVHTIHVGVPKTEEACDPQPVMPVPEELDYDLWLGPAPWAPYTEKRVHPRHDIKGRPGWMRVGDYCEGIVVNWGTHLISLAQWGNGTERTGPVAVEGRGTFPKEGLWNVLLDFRLEYRYADGVRLTYKMDRPYTRFVGSEGWIETGFDLLQADPPSLLKVRPKAGDHRLTLKHEKRDFIDAVKTRGPTVEDAEVGHRTTSLCQIGHIAIQLGRPLRWDPDKEEFPGDEEANRLRSRALREPWRL